MAAAIEGEVVEVKGSDAGAAVQLFVGQALRVHLDNSRASGYLWELEGDLPPGLRMETDPGVGPLPAISMATDGNPGQSWSFRATRPGRAWLRFRYRRPWQDGQEPARSAIFEIGVRQRP